jgi:hypothetical protein
MYTYLLTPSSTILPIFLGKDKAKKFMKKATNLFII